MFKRGLFVVADGDDQNELDGVLDQAAGAAIYTTGKPRLPLQT